MKCARCNKLPREKKAYCKGCNAAVNRESFKRRYKLARDVVYEHYGNACTCCGIMGWEFLSIDHKDGGGNAHRRLVIPHNYTFYHWVIKNNFPDNLQLLCMNCNTAKYRAGVCPHKNIP